MYWPGPRLCRAVGGRSWGLNIPTEGVSLIANMLWSHVPVAAMVSYHFPAKLVGGPQKLLQVWHVGASTWIFGYLDPLGTEAV